MAKTISIETAKQNQTQDPLAAEVARLKAENEALKAKEARRSTITCKVGDKGGVSVYGLGRFPVTLYREQWERLLAHEDVVKAFIKEHAAELKVKE